MIELLCLLLPLAFYSGWRSANRQSKLPQEQEKPVPARFVRGINFLLNEEPDKALDLFLNAPSWDAQTVDTFLALGKLFRNRGEVNRALRVHQYVIARPELSTRERQAAMLALGEDFFAAGLLDRAENVFREFMRHYPKNTQACEPLRHIYEQLQEWEKAIELAACGIEDKVERNKLVAHYLCEQAEDALDAKQLYQVEETLKKALVIQPKLARIQVLYAELALARGERQAALQYFKKAIEYDARLTSTLTKRFLEVFQQSYEAQQLQTFLRHEYTRQPDPHLFPALLALSQTGGEASTVEPLVKTHLQQGNLSLQSVARAAEWQAQQAPQDEPLHSLHVALARLVKSQPRFQCVSCGYKMQDYLWRCPACHRWETVHHL